MEIQPLDPSKKIFNNCYEKIVQFAKGSGGKVVLCKVVGEIGNSELNIFKNIDNQLKQDQKQQENSQNQIEEEKNQKIQHKQTIKREYVVVKRFNLDMSDGYGLRQDILHEIRFMKQFDHPNIVKQLDIFTVKKNYGNKMNLYIAMDLFLDLKDIDQSKIGTQERRCIAKQFVSAVAHLHKNWVIHRDIKPSNTFLNTDGKVILGDFGLARTYGSPNRQMSGNVVTKQYRAPEILYGTKYYADKVDIWSLGVSIAEQFIDWPVNVHQNERCLFMGMSEIDQLQKIFCIRGTPNEENWPGCGKLPLFMEFEHRDPVDLKEVIPKLPEDGVKILERMMALDPNQRPSAAECLEDPFFKNALEPEQTQLGKWAKIWYQEKLQRLLVKQNAQQQA